MSIKLRWPGAMPTGVLPLVAAVFACAALAALPTAPANASVSGNATVDIPSSDLGSIFETLPVSDLGLSNEQLSQVLSSIQGLGNHGSELESVVSSLLSSNPDATIGQLVDGVLGDGAIGLDTLHLALSPEQVLAALDPSQISTLLSNLPSTLSGDQIATLLGGLSGKLGAGQLESLQNVLAPVTGVLSTGELANLQADLKSLLSGLSAGNLSSVLNALKGALGGTQLTQLESLIGNLGSLNQSELQAHLEALLKGLSQTQLSDLLGTLVNKLEPSAVQTVLTDLLGNLPLSSTNAGSLADELGTSVEKLSSTVGMPLTSRTPALTSTLGKEGPVLSMLGGLEGLKLGLLTPEGAGGSGGKGGSAGNGGSGSTTENTDNTSQGGPNSGPSGTAGSTTTPSAQAVTIVLPGTSSTSKAAATKALTKVKIISHKVKGDVATLVLQVPSAGKVRVSGMHVTKVTRRTGKAERVRVKVRLTRAGAASLKRHKKLLRVVLKAAFSPKSGPASSAVTWVRFL